MGDSHSVISANIAKDLGANDRLYQIILSNDRAYSHWRKLLGKNGSFETDRWTNERRDRFVEEFGQSGLDLNLLVLFHRADNAYRRARMLDETVDPVFWFETKLVQLKLLESLPLEGKDQRLVWKAHVS